MLAYILVRFVHFFVIRACTHQGYTLVHFRACKSCEITPTKFVEWSLVVYKELSALILLAEALPSENIRERFGRGLVETHLCVRKTRELSKDLPN
jgi:hypothetical protein